MTWTGTARDEAGRPGADIAPSERRLAARLGLAALGALLVSVPFLLLMLLVLGNVGWLRRLDRGVADALHTRVLGFDGRTDALIFVQEVAQPWRLYCVSAVVLLALLVRRRVRLAMWLVAATLTGWFLGFSLKLVVQRARPSFPDPVETAPGYSFPSGHALNSVIFAGTMALLLDRVVHGVWRVVVWALAVLFVLVVGFDRVAIGAHYVSDVVAGWAVGVAVLVATVVAFATWRKHEHLSRAEGDAL